MTTLRGTLSSRSIWASSAESMMGIFLRPTWSSRQKCNGGSAAGKTDAPSPLSCSPSPVISRRGPVLPLLQHTTDLWPTPFSGPPRRLCGGSAILIHARKIQERRGEYPVSPTDRCWLDGARRRNGSSVRFSCNENSLVGSG